MPGTSHLAILDFVLIQNLERSGSVVDFLLLIGHDALRAMILSEICEINFHNGRYRPTAPTGVLEIRLTTVA